MKKQTRLRLVPLVEAVWAQINVNCCPAGLPDQAAVQLECVLTKYLSGRLRSVFTREEILWERILYELTPRTRNALDYSNLQLSQILSLSEDQMLRIRRIGKGSLEEIKEVLAGFELSLGMSEDEVRRVFG